MWRRYGPLILLDAGLARIQAYLADRLYWPSLDRYRLKDAVFCRDIYWWVRGTAIAREIGTAAGRVLDIGCGGSGLWRFVHRIELSVVSIDVEVSRDAKKRYPDVEFVRADGTALPFKKDAFEAAAAVAVLPAVPANRRDLFLNEMRRVAPQSLLFVEAVDDSGVGRYRGLEWEWEFHQRAYPLRRMTPYAPEKLNSRRIDFEWLNQQSRRLTGMQNYDVTMRYSVFACRPVAGIIAAIWYWQHQDNDHDPPYKAALVVLKRDRTSASLFG